MRKINIIILTLLITICFLPINIFAAGSVSVSTTSLTITKGSTKTFTITANNAAGKIDISSSNTSVASVSTSSIFLDMQSNTITVTANSAGTAVITVVTSDVTTYDDEDISGRTYTINVTVNEPSNNNNNNNNTNNNLSKNNNIKSISIEGYELVKVDNNNYKLTVNNNITSVNVNAEAEDTKAKVSGTGKHELNIGENKIEVIITSESGSQNKINVIVTRKDGYYLEDLDNILKDNTINDIQIIINEDTKISLEDLQKIKDNKKKTSFNYYDQNKKLIYSWNIDGTRINDVSEFITTISFTSDKSSKIFELSNYADGLYINFSHSGDLPKGTNVKLYVGNKFADENTVKLYYYNLEKDKLELKTDNLIVKEGYIEFDIEHCSDYFVTMSTIPNIKADGFMNKNIFVGLVIIIVMSLTIGIYFLIKKMLNKRLKERM